jgi:hypothetical protein
MKKDFWEVAEKPPEVNFKKAFSFGKKGKVKKSFKGEGLKL